MIEFENHFFDKDIILYKYVIHFALIRLYQRLIIGILVFDFIDSIISEIKIVKMKRLHISLEK